MLLLIEHIAANKRHCVGAPGERQSVMQEGRIDLDHYCSTVPCHSLTEKCIRIKGSRRRESRQEAFGEGLGGALGGAELGS